MLNIKHCIALGRGHSVSGGEFSNQLIQMKYKCIELLAKDLGLEGIRVNSRLPELPSETTPPSLYDGSSADVDYPAKNINNSQPGELASRAKNKPQFYLNFNDILCCQNLLCFFITSNLS